MSALVVGVVLDGRGEEGVDEGRLAQTRLASNLRAKACVLVTVRTNKQSSSPGRRRVCKRQISRAIAYHDGEASSTLRDNLVSLVGQIGNANR